IAPAAFLGNLLPFKNGQIAFDLKIFNKGTAGFDALVGTTTITSPTGAATLDIVPDEPPPSWKSYQAPLTAAAWGKTPAEWDSILANVTGIQIDVEGYTGSDITGFDNFSLTAAPEPSDCILLTIGVLICVGTGTRVRCTCCRA